MSFDEDLVGKRFGRYKIIGKVGVGGMAEVYLAETSSDKPIAIKKIMSSFTDSEKFIRMFLDEAKIMITLKHPNVVDLYDFGKIDNVYYLAMEYINGKPLSSIVKRQIKQKMLFPEGIAVFIAMEICSGLDYAHNRKDSYNNLIKIVHRDISPPNILLSWQGDVKIADFGVAKAKNKVILTKPGILKGKFSYMSPEQAKGEDVDARSDIFSLGVVLYEMLTGTRLFLRNKDYKTIEAVKEDKILSPRVYNPLIPLNLEEVVMKALDRSIKRRYQTAREFGDELEKVLSENYFGVNSGKVASFMQFLYPGKQVVDDQANRKASINFWSLKAKSDSDILKDVNSRVEWHRKSFLERFWTKNWFILIFTVLLIIAIYFVFLFIPSEIIGGFLDKLKNFFK